MNNTALQRRDDTQFEDARTEALRQIAEQATPKHEIRVRAGRGGMQLKYTDGAYVIRTLNQAFGWDWDFVADNEELLTNNGKPFEVKVRGTLTVRLNGQAVTKTQYGCQPIEMLKNGDAPVSIGDAYKGAATDAMKKCASLLGIALDLYDSDSEVNTGRKAPTPAPQPVRQVAPPLEADPVEAPPDPRPTNGREKSTDGTVRAIISLADYLGFSSKYLADEVYRRFRTSISEEHPARGIEELPKAQKQELLQALQQEKNSRTV